MAGDNRFLSSKGRTTPARSACAKNGSFIMVGYETERKSHPLTHTHDRDNKNQCVFEFVCRKPAEP